MSSPTSRQIVFTIATVQRFIDNRPAIAIRGNKIESGAMVSG